MKKIIIGLSAFIITASNLIAFAPVSSEAVDINNKVWQQLYQEKLSEFLTSDDFQANVTGVEHMGIGSTVVAFDLCDINKDGIPELFITRGTYHGAKCEIYTVDQNNELVDMGEIGAFGECTYIVNRKLLYSACNQGHSYQDFFEMVDNKLEMIFDANTGSTFTILGNDSAVYYINGELSDKLTYEQKLATYYDPVNDTMERIGRTYILNKANILSVLKSYASETQSNVTYGDPNGDGKIDANDATFVLIEYAKLSTGGETDLTEEEQSAADINKDGKIDSKDSSVILGYYSYLSTGGKDSLENYLNN